MRHCTAGALRNAGFVVTHTPSRMNPDHISVTLPDGAAQWDDGQANGLEMTFAIHEAFGKEGRS